MMSFNKFISHEVMFAEHGVKIEKKKVILQFKR